MFVCLCLFVCVCVRLCVCVCVCRRQLAWPMSLTGEQVCVSEVCVSEVCMSRRGSARSIASENGITKWFYMVCACVRGVKIQSV